MPCPTALRALTENKNNGTPRAAREQGRGPYRVLTTRLKCVYVHTMRSRDVIERLEAAGWREVGQKGSHVQFKHPKRPGRVTVPHPKREIPIGTLRSIEKQSGLKLR
jgi:predicted RNA binding protein YcfA (HicA-like mRNA interferase family)